MLFFLDISLLRIKLCLIAGPEIFYVFIQLFDCCFCELEVLLSTLFLNILGV